MAASVIGHGPEEVACRRAEGEERIARYRLRAAKLLGYSGGMLTAPLALLLVAAAPTPSPAKERLAFALNAFRQGEYAQSARALSALPGALPKNHDYYLYFLGESQFYAGDYGKARSTFVRLGRSRASRFAAVAPWRVADCLWMEGQRSVAAAAYRKVVRGTGGDAAIARFRMAEVQAEMAHGRASEAAAAGRAFMQIHVEFPAHPLAAEAGRRAALLLPPQPGKTARAEPSPRERLRRAATLSDGRHWQEALDELALLPSTLPPDLSVERDFAMGMAKYNGRRDYAGAAQLLLSVAPKLSGEKAAFAAFHGARALSRIDRDDEAIARYHEVVARYPSTRWAAAGQFRAGWLEINRGRFRAALPDLESTLTRYPKGGFADDAAWYLALAHYLLGESAQALTAIDTYERASRRSNTDAMMRALYWRARILAQAGEPDDAKRLLAECAKRSPWSYYALLAQARLREVGEAPPAPTQPKAAATPSLRDPAVARVRELEQAGLDLEAAYELERAETDLVRRHGKAATVPFLLASYARLQAFYRAYKLAGATDDSPLADTRLYWEASYPRAFASASQAYGKASGVSDLFIYAVMRKESTYYPFAVSPADARGLMQLIPSTSAEVAKHLGIEVFPDELFDPDTNIRLGTTYLGGLLRRFRGQEALAAGAYNAGARAMMRWCDQWSGRAFDEFVELVTYDQAREYIKRVLAIYARYRYLYGQPLDLPLTVNTQYLKDGFDF
jgi:soluble lytic murein transglycosylase